MVDFNKYLDRDLRSAAEVMEFSEGCTCDNAPGCLLHDPPRNKNAGPAASQIFDAAVMREQVDPGHQYPEGGNR